MSALAIAAGASLVAPATAVAVPATESSTNSVPMVPEGVPTAALSALAPAIVNAPVPVAADIAAPGPQDAILAQARALLDTVNLPPQIKSTLERVITFLDGSDGGGPEIPESGPEIAQFLYPTIGKGCIAPSGDSIGTALAVPGPAQLPPPGPAAGQTGFVFTALGTERPTAEQPQPLTVQWRNLDTGAAGSEVLTGEANINPDGPATLSAIANTGAGRVVAVIGGGLTTQATETEAKSCAFAPTIGFFTVA